MVASVEVAHDNAHDGAALENNQPISKTHHEQTPLRARRGKGMGDQRMRGITHDDACAGFGLPTICTSKTLTNPSIAYLPAVATSPE